MTVASELTVPAVERNEFAELTVLVRGLIVSTVLILGWIVSTVLVLRWMMPADDRKEPAELLRLFTDAVGLIENATGR